MHSKNLLMKAFWGIRWLHMRKKGYQLSLDAKIGKNFSLLHHGTRIIVGIASLGEHCTVGVNVVIGYAYNKETGRHEAPEIGDRVYVGHNATLVGKITVGNDVLIAPNAYVNTNIPSHSIVIGNNIIIPKTNASEKYLDLDNNN